MRNLLLIAVIFFGLAACHPDEALRLPETENTEGTTNENETNNKETMSNKITVRINNNAFAATLENNATARAFAALLPMEITMQELNGNEKYYYLQQPLPTSTYRPGTIHSGDLMLYGSNCLVLFYETFSSSYSYTPIGRLDNPQGIEQALDGGDTTVTFELQP